MSRRHLPQPPDDTPDDGCFGLGLVVGLTAGLPLDLLVIGILHNCFGWFA